ncbi:MAG: response regulator [Nitrospinaceae bacterium]|nr:MAG: response regulator [Nitrospinaceae bacterium]
MTSKILVADDSITIQKIVAMAFEHEDTVVEGTSNGKDAFNRLAVFKPDIVLADVDMPGINGFELSKKIKDSQEFNAIPVLLLASDFEEFNSDLFRYSRADDHISKPFKSEEIIEKVKARLEAALAQANVQASSILQAETEGLDDSDEMLFVLSEEHLIEEPGKGLLGENEPAMPEPAMADFEDPELDFELSPAHLVANENPEERLAAAEAVEALDEDAGEMEEPASSLDFYLAAEGPEADAPGRDEILSSPSLFGEEGDGATEGEEPFADFPEMPAEPIFDEKAFLASESGVDAGLDETLGEHPAASPPAVSASPPAESQPARPQKSFEDLMSLVDRLSHQGERHDPPAEEKAQPPAAADPVKMPETAAVIDRVIYEVDAVKEATLSKESRTFNFQRSKLAEEAAPAANEKTADGAEEDVPPRRSPFFSGEPAAPKAVPPAVPEADALAPEAERTRQRELKEIARSLEEAPVARLDEDRIKRVLENSLDQAIKKELAGFSEAVLNTLRDVVREVAADAIKAAIREEMEKISKWRSE